MGDFLAGLIGTPCARVRALCCVQGATCEVARGIGKRRLGMVVEGAASSRPPGGYPLPTPSSIGQYSVSGIVDELK